MVPQESSTTLLFGDSMSLSPGVPQFRSAGRPGSFRNPPVTTYPALIMQVPAAMSGFEKKMSIWGSNLGPHACMEGTLSSLPNPGSTFHVVVCLVKVVIDVLYWSVVNIVYFTHCYMASFWGPETAKISKYMSE